MSAIWANINSKTSNFEMIPLFASGYSYHFGYSYVMGSYWSGARATNGDGNRGLAIKD